MKVLKRIKPLLVLFAICWIIQGIGIMIFKDMPYIPMPGEFDYEYRYNENSKL